MPVARPIAREVAETAAAKSLRSGSSSALIESDEPRPNERTEQPQGRTSRKSAPTDPLDGAPVVVSIRHTKPGSPLDEHLRREQIRALLDLLADHAARQEHHPKVARRC
jgi:hypothetical protein